MASINIALIGGGLFARMEHMPAIMKCSTLELKAIYSRSLKSAEQTAALATKAQGNIDLYSTDSGDDKSLESLLSRADILAVIIALPIATQPAIITQAIRAGKHVLSEKPIAPDITTAQELIKTASLNSNISFSVAENFRFTPKFVYAAEQAKQLGKITHFSIKMLTLFKKDNLWYQTEWRQNPNYQGGPVLDAGVHFAAAMRLFLKGDSTVESVSAQTNSIRDYLPPIDTVNAVIRLKSGVSGTFQISFGSHMEAFEWDIGFENGGIKVSGDTVTVKNADGKTDCEEFPWTFGVGEEIAAWAEGIVSGQPNQLLSAKEALADLEILDKMFKSAESGGSVTKYAFQYS